MIQLKDLVSPVVCATGNYIVNGTIHPPEEKIERMNEKTLGDYVSDAEEYEVDLLLKKKIIVKALNKDMAEMMTKELYLDEYAMVKANKK